MQLTIPAPSADHTLLLQLQQQLPGAFEQMYTVYFPRLVTVAQRIVKDEDTAKDVAQQVLMRFWERKSYGAATDLQLYLLRSVRNEALMEHRKRVHDHRLKNALLLHSGNSELSNTFERSETRRVFMQLLKSLPRQQASVLVLYYLHNLRKKQVAAALGIGTNSVKTHLLLARKHFITKLFAPAQLSPQQQEIIRLSLLLQTGAAAIALQLNIPLTKVLACLTGVHCTEGRLAGLEKKAALQARSFYLHTQEGLSYPAIAARLQLSTVTVNRHLKSTACRYALLLLQKERASSKQSQEASSR